MQPSEFFAFVSAKLSAFGFRVTPVYRDGSTMPYAKGQSYPYVGNEHLYAHAVNIAAVTDNHLLADLDGNKPNASAPTTAELSAAIGAPLPRPAQGNVAMTSLHYLFRMPDGIDIDSLYSSRDGTWLHGVDLKRGNQLMHIKQVGSDGSPKWQNWAAFENPPVATSPLIDALRKPTVPQVPPAPLKQYVEGEGSEQALAMFNWEMQQLAEVPEGERNTQLNGKAYRWLRIAHSGDLDPDYVKDKLREAAAINGCDGVESTIASADKKAATVPRRYQEIPNAADAFGVQISSEAAEEALKTIDEYGGNPTKIREIITKISAVQDPLVQARLADYLKGVLKDAREYSSSLGKQIDGAIRPSGHTPRSFVPEVSPLDLPVVTGEHAPFEAFEVPAKQDFPGDDVNDAIFMLVAIFQNRLRVYAGTFYWWTGRLWEPLGKGVVKRAIGLSIRADRKKATSSRVSSIFEEMRNQAQTLEPDPPAPRVYFQNGVLHIPSGEFTHHNPDNGNTRTLSVDYDPAVTAPQWLTWLSEIFQGEPERIELLQELIGWLLVRHTFGIEKAVLFVGPPRAGKGVIARSVQALLGSGATNTRINELDDPKLLATMRGKHVAIDPDAVSAAPRNARSVMGLFKAITSNDPIALTLLYTQEPWQGQLDCKLLVLANSVPSMFDDSAATANRWVPLVFDRSYLGSEDPELFKRLAGELTGIAAWAVNGLLRLVNRARFSLPQSSLDQVDSLISDGGTVQDFIGECLLVGQEHRCSETELWEAYRGWAVNSGHELGKRRHVLKSLEDALRGEGVRRSKSVRLEDGRDHRGFYGAGIPPVKTARNVLAFRPSDS